MHCIPERSSESCTKNGLSTCRKKKKSPKTNRGLTRLIIIIEDSWSRLQEADGYFLLCVKTDAFLKLKELQQDK